MNDKHRKLIELNREAWERYTGIHVRSGFYDVDSFKKGESSLHTTEIEELGNVRGCSILHLQCHFGLDTLSLERMGARCTGVDFSSESIENAKSLAEELGLSSGFIEADIYDLRDHLQEKFEIVFTSYGVLFWLPDLNEWARLIADFLQPGGRFYIIEFHPFLDTLDEEFQFFKYPYFNKGNEQGLEFDESGTYAVPEADIETTTYGWPHSLSEVITSLRLAGLEIDFFHEFSYSHYCIFPDMIEFEPSKYYHKGLKNTIPYMYSIMAVKRS